jgi:two-component system, NtrC family, nitrogen regulation response regulator NtrX
MLPDPRRLYEGYAGESQGMDKVWEQMRAALRTRAPVLVRGESGTGKELVAKTLSKASGKGPWVVVNCCAISESLIESELFGHARGAFSGADRDREGLFETADGGCLFLDEIGDIPPSAQARLLRVLQEGEVRRVGESRVRHVDVRVIAATNRDLEVAMEAGNFRADLFYRLSVHPIVLPPLRHRREDIPGLVRHLVKKHTLSGQVRPVSPEAMELLQSHAWPGNVREMENVLLRLMASGGSGPIRVEEVKPGLQPSLGTLADGTIDFLSMDYPGLRRAQDEMERRFVVEHLRRHQWSVSKASQNLGIARTALHNRLKALGLETKALKGDRTKEG